MTYVVIGAGVGSALASGFGTEGTATFGACSCSFASISALSLSLRCCCSSAGKTTLQQQKNARLPSSPASPLRPGCELPGHDQSSVQSQDVLTESNSAHRASASPGGRNTLSRLIA